ncbi:MAG: (2Fe-2S) ferredoxin domain-containing protein [Chloroflexota bacterium]|nr:(2Fe-2S) ferredoxin domain-containing protein [Chloroflexota bacterium]
MVQPTATTTTPSTGRPEQDQWAFVCEASDCRLRGSIQVRDALAQAVQGDADCARVAVVRTGCLSLCGAGPAVVTYPAGDVHLRVEAGDALELARRLASGESLARRAVRAPQWYRERIKSRLGYLVQLLRERVAGGISPG